MLTIKKVREAAKEHKKELVFNKSTGMYHITRGFEQSDGVIPYRTESGKLGVEQKDLQFLLDCI